MSKNHLKAAILGGLIIFVWSFVSWMVFPWHKQCLQKFTNQSEVARVIQDNAPTSGVYVLPNTFGYNEKTSHEEMHKAEMMMENGPFMFATVMPNGAGKMSARPFIFSLIIQVIGAFIAIWMLMQTKGLNYKKSVCFITLFGLGVAVLGQLPEWNWWGFAGAYVLVNMADLVIGWFLAGLAIAKLIKK